MAAAIRAEKVKKPSPLRVVATSLMTTASPTSTAKTPIMRRCMPAMGVPIVRAAIGRMAVEEEEEGEDIVGAVGAGEAAEIVGRVAVVEIVGIAKMIQS